MANMAYCRFQNTLADLRDCERALEDSGLEGLSREERRAAIRLVKLADSISNMFLADVLTFEEVEKTT